MTRKEWQAINEARHLLGLGKQASLVEIKESYRRLSKLHHPDLQGQEDRAQGEMMSRLTDAYQLLLRYCASYRFPLIPPEGHVYDAEDWWLDRFGQDPLWGRRR